MRKYGKGKLAATIAVAACGAVLAFGLAGCGGSGSSSAPAGGGGSSAPAESSAAAAPAAAEAGSNTITVAAVAVPHGEILSEVVKPIMAEQGYDLVVKEFTDYVLPNTATEQNEVDANYFQHGLYLDQFNAEQGTHLVSVTAVHYEPFGLYAGKDGSLKSLDDLPEGAKVAVPNDPTNEARALNLLQEAGLIKVNPEAGLSATKADVIENPRNLDIIELEAAQTALSLQDVDVAGINSNYALEAGLVAMEDALVAESPDDPNVLAGYANLLVVKEGNENNPAVQALAAALNTDAVRDYINQKYKGAVLPVF